MTVRHVLLTVMLITASQIFAKTNPLVEEFNKRVEQYENLHKKVEDKAPPIDKKKEPDPETIIAHERALADGIRAARANVREGNIFAPRIQKLFILAIRRGLESGGKTARDMLLGEGNPRNPESPAKLVLEVNAKYPTTAPLSTMPPSVLLNLPQLPQGLEYRFVGRHMILFDSKANLIVDILRNAVR